jgi:hypothetical protein
LDVKTLRGESHHFAAVLNDILVMTAESTRSSALNENRKLREVVIIA